MVDVFAVGDLLVSHAVKAHGEEVDLIGYYGSRAQGTARPDSDLDIFYIPAEGTNPPIGRTFLLDGRLFDFWAITWETMGRFATGEARGWAFAPALVYYVKILHVRSEAQASRLEALRKRILHMQGAQARPEMIRRAARALADLSAEAGRARLAASDGGIGNLRRSGWQVVMASLECLALGNQVFFERGLRRSLGELEKLKYRPDNLHQLIVTIAVSGDPEAIARACEELLVETRQVVRSLEASLGAKATVAGRFGCAYPEIKDMMGKLLRACDDADPVAISAAAWFLQSDLSSMLDEAVSGKGREDRSMYGDVGQAYREVGLPDLLQIPPDQPGTMRERVGLLDDRLRKWLSEHSVCLNEYDSLDQLACQLET